MDARQHDQKSRQFNLMIDVLLSQLPTATHGLVLVVCWRHADQNQVFELSHSRIADALGVTRRHVIRIMADLQRLGAIVLISKGSGVKPSTYKVRQLRHRQADANCDLSLYLMRHSNGLTKIGRSVQPKAREKTLQAEDPRLEMILCVEGQGHREKTLHRIFDELRVRGEWFRLEDRHVEWIKFFLVGFAA